MRQMLQERTQKSYEQKDDTGQFKPIWLEGLDPPLKLWKCGEAEHFLDIIPYLAGRNDPKTPEGSWTYWFDVWVHYNVGATKDVYICLARTYRLPCPICEYRTEYMAEEDYDEDIAGNLKPSRRSIYNVVVYDTEKEEAKGVQVFDASHWLMERLLVALTKPARSRGGQPTGGYVTFSDPVKGKTISFERKGKGKEGTDFIGHKFEDRDYEIGENILEQAYCLDEIVHIPSYEEVKEAFYGEEEEEETGEEFEEGIPESVKQPVERERPRSRRLPGGAPAGEPEHVCPIQEGTFGPDCENFPECAQCEIYDPCSEESDRLRAEKPEVVSEPEQKPDLSTARRRPLLNRSKPNGPRQLTSRRRK